MLIVTTFRSPEMLAPASMPVAAGKNIPNIIKKDSIFPRISFELLLFPSSRNEGPDNTVDYYGCVNC